MLQPSYHLTKGFAKDLRRWIFLQWWISDAFMALGWVFL